MSKLVTKQAEIDSILGLIFTAVGKDELDECQQHHALWITPTGMNHFRMKFSDKLFDYVYTRIRSAETLNELSDFYHYERGGDTAVGNKKPEVVYGIVGWEEFSRTEPMIGLGDATTVKREMAWRALVCLAFDYVRQSVYHGCWRDLYEDVDLEHCC